MPQHTTAPKHPDDIVGGGVKKVLYTLQTVNRIGLRDSAKALSAKNACKACGLGMGGQRGGMTDEMGDFPAVCNKSIQAQSTDIQPAIPHEIFKHSLDDLRELSGYEIEHLGRLGTPIYKEAGADKYAPVSWETALNLAAAQLKQTDPKRTFFYSSGRSSNEAGFVFQLFARLYGTNNVNNCSYYCHQATSVGLGTTIGTGTSTVELEDLTGCDLIFLIGANPSSNHPRFIHKLKACRERGGHVVVINPAKEPGLVKFAVPRSPASLLGGGSDIASIYVQPKVGSDIAVLKGLAKAVLEFAGEDREFVNQYTEGFNEFAKDLDDLSWEEISEACGVSEADLHRVAKIYCASKSTVFAWGMGVTHHIHGVENVEAIANLALVRGMVGKRFAGLLPLRGHSNVQGIGTIGVKPVLANEVLNKMEDEFDISLPKTKGLDTMGCMQAADGGKVDAAIVMGGNLYGANPNREWAEQALNKIGFKLFLTTTLNLGHVHGVDKGEVLILPVTARDEEWEPTTQESMFNFVRMSDGGITRLDTVRPETVILSDLADRVLEDSPLKFDAFRSHKRTREAIASIVPGMEDLKSLDVAKQEFHVRGRLMHTPEFKREGGRAQFRLLDVPKTRPSGEQDLVLTTVRSEGQFNTIVYEEKDSYRGTDTRWSVLMNAQDMADRHLIAGDKVDIHSEHGEMNNVTVYPFDVVRGGAMAYFPEANCLVGTDVDPRSKTPSFKATPVKVIKR